MHIGMILNNSNGFPPDIRVEKEIKALVAQGHRVTVLSRFNPHRHSRHFEPFLDNIAFIRRENVASSKTIDSIRSGVFLRQANWYDAIEKFFQIDKPDAVHVHDFGILPTAIHINHKWQRPVIADLHENMPANFVAKRTTFPYVKRLFHAVIYNYWIWRYYEKKYLKKCYKILVVVPEASKRLLRYGIEKGRIEVVSNTEDETTYRFEPEEADRKILNSYKNDWMISYIGGVGPHRGVDTVLKALPKVKSKIPNLKFVIVGAKPDQIRTLKELVNEYQIHDEVEILGWLPFNKANSYMLASKISLIPHNDFEHTQTTIPHKLFQAMICKKPVLVSNVKPLERIVSDSRSGRIFKANDSDDLAEKLISMSDKPKMLAEMGENARHAALGKYSWKHDAKRLTDIYTVLQNLN